MMGRFELPRLYANDAAPPPQSASPAAPIRDLELSILSEMLDLLVQLDAESQVRALAYLEQRRQAAQQRESAT